MTPSFILWSGGKESYVSLIKARQRGFRVSYALSYVEERTRRLIGCHLREEIISYQLSKVGIRFVPVYGSKRKGNFIPRLREVLIGLGDLEAGIFGDVRNKDHRNLLEKVCRDLGIRPVFPLWGVDERWVVREALSLSVPILVCRRVRILKRSLLGKPLSLDIAEDLLGKGLSPAGENGEYQTFVVKGRDFSLDIKIGRTFRRSYYECIDIIPGG